jgi:hypothetical protein
MISSDLPNEILSPLFFPMMFEQMGALVDIGMISFPW